MSLYDQCEEQKEGWETLKPEGNNGDEDMGKKERNQLKEYPA